MKKLLLCTIIMLEILNAVGMQRQGYPRITVITQENIDTILSQHTFETNNKDLARLAKKRSTLVYLLHKNNQYSIEVERFGKKIATYNKVIPTKTNTNTNRDE